MVQQHLPQQQQQPWLEKPVTGALKHLLHEQDFIAFLNNARTYKLLN